MVSATNTIPKINIPNRIAIVGLAGRFPGAKTIDQFWQNLRDGVEAISTFTDAELMADGVEPSLLHHPNYVKAGAVLDEVDCFDADFFGFSPKEAEMIDPQQRLFLESAWEALEQAGYSTAFYPGRIGAFAGVGWSSYLFNNLYTQPELIETVGGYQTLIGNDKDFLATRLAYKLNLKGPSYTVQTACSTSLVAVSLACQSLLNYQCDLALAGGVTVFVPQKQGYLHQAGGIFSPDGHCRAFDASAQGTIAGSGIGIVVLKRLEEAIAEGDTIHAVICGAAVNNDGAQKVGYTAPSVEGQAEVIAEALALADIDPETVTYVEAHGTGTALGDPIEVAALTQAFRASTPKRGFCALGSVKTNIGHLDAAAGIAGLIKTVLALKHCQIPPTLHFEQPNPQIDFANSPFYVNTQLTDWKPENMPRRAGVSAFGIGGTNAHVILEEAPTIEQNLSARPWQLILLSARTESALDTATTNLAQHLRQHPEANLANAAYTLQVGRRAFDYRRMLVCQTASDATAALTACDPQQVLTYVADSSPPPIVFMFPGQGAQYVNMARDLYQTEPVFREQVDRCCDLLQPHLDLDLRQVLYPESFNSNDCNSHEKITSQESEINETALTQPALFVVEYALAQLWMSWGIQPWALIGHSIGEYVAACVAGVFALEDALQLVAQRGQFMQSMPTGDMLSVSLSAQEIKRWLEPGISLAASNAPNLSVVSGDSETIAHLHRQLTDKGINCRLLHTSHAFHSAMMEPIVARFEEAVSRISLQPPTLPLISNVTGTWMTAAEAIDPSYWANHLRQTVQFAGGVAELLKQPGAVFLEVGPSRTLSTLVRQQVHDQLILTSIRHPKVPESDIAFLLGTLGRLWLVGVDIDWAGFYQQEQRQRIPLPTYPFERQRYWIEAQPAEVRRKKSQPSDDASLQKQGKVSDWFYIPTWKQSISYLGTPKRSSIEKSLTWLIFVDRCDVGHLLTEQLQQAGQTVITVQAGAQFTPISAFEYAINPEHDDDYYALLAHLRTLNQMPDRIVHCWSVTADELPNSSENQPNTQSHTQSIIDAFESHQQLGFYSLLLLTQALSKLNVADPFSQARGQQEQPVLPIVVITNHVQNVIGTERLFPAKATVLAHSRVIPNEYSNLFCRSVDIVLPPHPFTVDSPLIQQLFAELTINTSVDLSIEPPAFEPIVAYRGTHRWVQTFEPISLEATDATDATTTPNLPALRQQGVYLITGALSGEAGLGLAEHLAQTVQARLVLIGQSAFPRQQEWEQWLATHDAQNEMSLKIQQLQAIEASGAEVFLVQADGSNFEQMQQAVNQAIDRFGTIHGVIHAVETFGDALFRPMQQTGRTECQWHFQPKAHGLIVLEQVLQNRTLDFCLLQSSIVSIIGGSVAHTAANIFMDAFAHRHHQTNYLPWLSVNWDYWKFWDDHHPPTTITPTAIALAMSPEQGLSALQRVLSVQTPQVVISTANLPTRLTAQFSAKSHSTLAATPTTTAQQHSRPSLQTAYAAPQNPTEQAVTELWQELLGITPVGVYDNFFELGGHSLLAVQLVSRLRDRFQVELPLRTLLFEAPTVAELSVIIAEQQPQPEEMDVMAQLLAEIETLSPEDAQQLLTEDA
jgi:acyl transferase domain-containing protein